ncbi:MAG: CHASE2 domain-containing protein [Ignavibacteriaceae bacterium]
MKKETFIKLLIVSGVSLLIILLTQNVLFTIGPFEDFELSQIDERFRRRGAIDIKDSADVVIVEITDATFKGIPPPYNSWPFPRNLFSKLVKNLTEAGAKTIGIDVLMSTPDKFSPLNDSLFVQTLKSTGNVVLGGKIEFTTAQVTPGTSTEVIPDEENFGNIFYKADGSIGIVNVLSDNDGVVRRYLPFRLDRQDKRVPTFGFALLNKYYNLPVQTTAKIEKGIFRLGNTEIPKFDNISLLINFYGGDKAFPRFNFLDIIDDKEFKTAEEVDYEEDVNTWDDPEFGLLHSGVFKDKIVLFGSTMPEDKDIVPISFSAGERQGENMIYGVEAHAHLIQCVINNDFITRLSLIPEILLVIFITFLVFFASSRIKSVKTKYSYLLEIVNVLMVVLLFMAIRFGTFYFFENHKILFTTLGSYSAVLLGYFASTAYHFVVERKQKTQIKGMFSQYLNSDVVNELISDPDKLKLGGEQRELTILFSDIAGFSSFSETKSPEELVNFLNSYLSDMTESVFMNKGTLDKYLGDSVMAFWGAPVPVGNHAELACRTALEMQRRLAMLQGNWKSEDKKLFFTRIGINSGRVIVGNIGGKQRFDYTVIGDNVNLASRLEGVNKEYGTRITVSDSTYELVKTKFFFRELDLIVVKGRVTPLSIYELIAERSDELPSNVIESLSFFSEGLKYYREMKFGEAAENFRKALEFNNDDQPSMIFLQRSRIFIDNPPPADWDGVFVMTRK